MGFKLYDHISMVPTEYGSVLLDERTGAYFQLNPTGTDVVTGLIEQHVAAHLARKLVAEYDIAEEQAASDVAALIAQLRDAELVQP
ncbi:lasso peptide biosynthesis PqqD family chaperone [Streptomyces sp. NPDC097619]|uniref:lasso peptide biosynthesis PqqD family chaperone n=1 Tax=Streptomyces sp. NPDC097619 TaxID=3157228 RepID=UPI003318F6D6